MKFFGILLLTYISLCAQGQILAPPIIYQDFANGIPASWGNGIISTNNVAHWEYRGPQTTPDMNTGPRGSCSAGSAPIASITQSNGFVIFDSNWWDDSDEVCDGNDSGQDPAPHTAWLITESYNFTGYTSLALTWQQQFKHYQTTTTKVFISTNNGATWTQILSNNGFYSPAAEWKTVNISAQAGNQANVKFKFEFSGTYYWWQLDDIAVYAPLPNDLQLTEPSFTTYGIVSSPIYFNDLPYDKYPHIMIPQFQFSGRATNIGGNTQTGVKLNVTVKKNGINTLYEQQTTGQTLTAGATSLIQLTPTFTSPAEQAKYYIYYNLTQNQTDGNTANNKDTLDYSITAYSYARDEGEMEDVFLPASAYSGQVLQVGNFFQARASNLKFHAIGVALGPGTQVGSQIYGIVYNYELNTVLGTTEPYTVNLFDINNTGEEKIVSLPLLNPILTQNDSLYLVMVANYNGSDALRVARSGPTFPESSLVYYPQSNGLFWLLKAPMVRMHLFPQNSIPGCMEVTAMNFNATATVDDGSCRYPGCTFNMAGNYNPNANWDDGSCIYSGCTNPLAINYNPYATINDGSCIIAGCTTPGAANFDPNATQNDGSCIFYGCTNPQALNYDPNANTDNGTCLIAGCTNPQADNYNPLANVDNGSCVVQGCTNPQAVNYNPQANVDNGTCIIAGCTDPTAANYNPDAQVDNGTCQYTGCTDPDALNYDPNANTNDFSCQYPVAVLTASIMQGCVPLTITLFNQTITSMNSQCHIACTDGAVWDSCTASFNHTLAQPGEYYFIYDHTLDDETTQYVLGPVVVYELPAPPLLQLQPDTYTLECINCQDMNLQWYYDGQLLNSGAASVQLLSGSIVQNGHYTLEIADANNCHASTEMPVLLARFSAPETACEGNPVNVVSLCTLPQGTTCLLDFGDGEMENMCSANYAHTYTGPGNYELNYQLQWNDLNAQAIPLNVEVKPLPPQPFLVFDAQADFVYCANCSGISSYLWYFNGQYQPGLNASQISYLGDGPYQLEITAANGCTNSSAPLQVVNDGVGEDETGIKVFPNPFDQSLQVTGIYGNWYIELLDNTGRVVQARSGSHPTEFIATEWLSPGVYALRVVTQAGTGSYILIKSK